MNTRPNQIAFGGDVHPAPSTAGELLSVSFVFGALRRRWPTTLLICLACLSGAAIYLLAAKPRFTAASMLLIDTKMQPPQPAQVGQASSEMIIDPGVIESQIEVLRSNKIAFDVVDRLNLARDPEFVPPGPDLAGRLVGAAGDLLGLTLEESARLDPRRTAVATFGDKVRIARSGRSFLAEISATTLDPDMSARIANAVAESYIQDQLSTRMEASQRTIEWMQQRLTDIKAGADAAEGALQDFRHDFRARRDACQGSECSADPASGTEAAGVGMSPRERELVRAAASARNTYEALETRVTRVSAFMQQEALPVTEARIVNTALPPSGKSAPKSGLLLVLGLVGGLVAGAAGACLREMSDRRLRWPAQVTRTLNQNYLGAFPPATGRQAIFGGKTSAKTSLLRMGGGRDGRPPMLTAGQGKSAAAMDALSSAKFLVDQGLERGRCPVVGIISAGRCEGKSTLTANFAALAAQMGARVLVVDADLRRGDLSRWLRLDGGGSLTDAARKGLRLAECVSGTDYGFDLLPAFSEAPPEHGLGILAAPAMHNLLAEAIAAYDYVLIDVPAILHGMEVRPLLREIDACILMAEAGTTTVDDLQRVFASCPAIEELAVGVILNRSRLTARHLIVRMPRLLKMAA